MNGSQTTGQRSSTSKRSLTSSMSSSVVAGVMRSTMPLGKRTSRSTQSPSSGSRRRANAVKAVRASVPLPWRLSHDITVNGTISRSRRRASASVTSPNTVFGVAPSSRSCATAGSSSTNSPVPSSRL